MKINEKRAESGMGVVAVLMLVLSLLAPAVVAEDADGDWLYEVKLNDTIWDICKNYVADKQCWRKLVEYNQIKTPKYLPPESIVRIPKEWLKPSLAQALVIAVEGEVKVSRDGEEGDRDVNVGDKLSQLDVITARNGSAMIKFADDSRLLLKPNSAVRMQGLRYYQRGGIADTQIRLLRGRVKANVEKLKGLGSRFDIATPAAVAAVRGTEFRVGLEQQDGKNIMVTELLEGALQLENDQGSQSLEAGEALRAVEGQQLQQPVSLLPRPRLDFSGAEDVVLPYQLQWFAVEGASFYKVSLRKEGLLLWEETTTGEGFEIDLPDDGEYEIQVSAVDAQGFEGKGRRLRMAAGTD